MNKISIVFFSGNRSEFGLMTPIIKRAAGSDQFKVTLAIAGAHLAEKFGSSAGEIVQENIAIDYAIATKPAGESKEQMIAEISLLLTEFTAVLRREKPDYVFLLGDRYETYAAAMAAFFFGIPIAHSGGGNKTAGGCIDDTVRHLITKLASLHFVTCEENAANIRRLGEENWRICNSGSPVVETLLTEKLYSKQELQEMLAINWKLPLILFTQHPISTAPEKAGSQIRESLSALAELGLPTVVTYPNADAGSDRIIQEYKAFDRSENLFFHKHLGRKLYLSVMKHCAVVVGNSSSGLLETPVFHVPAVNIGDRQKGRVRSTNVIDAPHDKEAIKAAVKKAIFDEAFIQQVKHCPNPFGNGETSKIILETLAEKRTCPALLTKTL